MSGLTCPRFCQCSAPICPIDSDWAMRTHLRGEPVCLYLRELVKCGGEARLGCHVSAEVVQAVRNTIQPACDRHGHLRRALERAKLAGTRMRKPGTAVGADARNYD